MNMVRLNAHTFAPAVSDMVDTGVMTSSGSVVSSLLSDGNTTRMRSGSTVADLAVENGLHSPV